MSETLPASPGRASFPRIGGYKVLAPAGQGGASVVYEAEAPSGEIVAVKLLLSAAPGALARFERERRLLAELGAGFVPLLDVGESEAGPYLVMPFLRAGTLRERLRRGRLSVGETRALGRALATTLGRAHARGVVHRDVKPENILFGPRGEPLVADLGIAKERGGAALSQTGETRGTPGYMAPEQLEDSKGVTPACDVFALGAVLYECLAGRPAFEGANLAELYSKIVAARFAPLRHSRTDLPDALAAAIERALSASPRERPDMAALERAFSRDEKAPVRRGRALVLAAWSRARKPEPPPPPPPKPAVRDGRPDLERARAFLAKREWENAIVAASNALAVEPGLVAASSARGRARAQTGDFAGAIADLSRVIEVDGRSADDWSWRAVARVSAGDLEGAMADAQRAVALEPRSARAHHSRALVHATRKEQREAFEDCVRATELDPTFIAGWCGRAFWGLPEEKDDALASAERAVALDPRFSDAWLARGLARQVVGSYEGAIDDFTSGLAVDPQPRKQKVFFNERGITHEALGELEAALEDFTRALEIDPAYGIVLQRRGRLRAKRGDHAGAIEDCTKVLEQEPGRQALWICRGHAREQSGDADGAADDYRHGLALEPVGPDADVARRGLARLGR